MKIITLVENDKAPDSPLEARFGLGLYIETSTTRILFDCGPDSAFVANAEKLGVDLSAVDAFVLSHAHFDHGGGLAHFLALNKVAPVYLLAAATGRYFTRMGDGSLHSIGLDPQLFASYAERFHFLSEDHVLGDDVFLFRAESQGSFRPKANATLFREDEHGAVVRDDFQHELLLVLRDGADLVLFTGCAHSGVTSMVRTARERLPGARVRTIVGGFHMVNPRTGQMTEDAATIREIASELQEAGATRVLTGHCTGKEAYAIIEECLGARLSGLHTGTTFEV